MVRTSATNQCLISHRNINQKVYFVVGRYLPDVMAPHISVVCSFYSDSIEARALAIQAITSPLERSWESISNVQMAFIPMPQLGPRMELPLDFAVPRWSMLYRGAQLVNSAADVIARLELFGQVVNTLLISHQDFQHLQRKITQLFCRALPDELVQWATGTTYVTPNGDKQESYTILASTVLRLRKAPQLYSYSSWYVASHIYTTT